MHVKYDQLHLQQQSLLNSATGSRPPTKRTRSVVQLENLNMPVRASARDVRRRTAVLPVHEQSELTRAIVSEKLDTVQRLLKEHKENPDKKPSDPDEKMHLHLACFLGNLDIVQMLLDADHLVNGRDFDWMGPLHRACYGNFVNVARLLLSKGADPFLRDRSWLTPMHTCAGFDAPECVELLLGLAQHANNPHQFTAQLIDAVDNMGATPLHHAAYNGHRRVASILLQKGANPRVRDHAARTPLHYAAANDDPDMIILLLESLKQLDEEQHQRMLTTGTSSVPLCDLQYVDPMDQEGHTPLMVATVNNNGAALTKLLQAGAQVNAQDRNGYTALHHCSERGHYKIIMHLLQKSASLSLRTRTGLSALHLCCCSFTGSMLFRVLKHYTNDLPLDSVDQYDRTSLHLACKTGVLRRVRDLLDEGARPDLPDKLGRTPLHYAVRARNLDVVVELLSAPSINVNHQDASGMTALHYAAINGDVDTLKKLQDNHADGSILDNEGRSAHHLAAHSYQCLQILKVMPLTVDQKGRNLLHYAAFKCEVRTFEYLPKRLTADELNRADQFGRTPLHYLCTQDDTGFCTRLLLEAGANCMHSCTQKLLPIHYAAAYGRKGALIAILELGNVNWNNVRLEPSPAALAAFHGSLDTLHVLVDAGMGDRIARCIELATLNGHSDCVQFMLRMLSATGGRLAAGAQYASMSTTMAAATCYQPAPAPEQTLAGALQIAALSAQPHCFHPLLQPISRIEAIVDWAGRTLLMLAALRCRNNYECIESLLKRGASVTSRDRQGRTVLFYATFSGHEEAVRHFMNLGVDALAQSSRGKSALHLAAALGHADILCSLMRVGGFGPCESCDSPPVEMETEGADTVIEDTQSDDGNKSNLKDELNSEKPNAVMEEDTLVAIGSCDSDPVTDCDEDESLPAIPGAGGSSIASTPSDSMCDMSGGRGMAGQNLFKHRDGEGLDPLHWAAFKGKSNTVTVLLEHCSRSLPKLAEHEITHLHLACAAGSVNCARLLIHHFGVKYAHLLDARKRSAMHYLAMCASGNDGRASSEGASTCSSLLKLLQECGLGVNEQDERGHTPLMYAIHRNNSAICDLLLSAGSDVNLVDHNGDNALHYASMYGMEVLGVSLILQAPSLVNALNVDEDTPLHVAARNGMSELVKQLLSNDANVSLRNKNHETPSLCCVSDRLHAECLDMIEAIMLYEERKDAESVLETDNEKSNQLRFSSPLSIANRRSTIERRSRLFTSPRSSGRLSFNADCSDISLLKNVAPCLSHRRSLDAQQVSTPTEWKQEDIPIIKVTEESFTFKVSNESLNESSEEHKANP